MGIFYKGDRLAGVFSTEHYHGEAVRELFLAAGAIMIASFALFATFIGVSATVAVIIVLGLVIFAGIQSPQYFWVKCVNAVISVVGCGVIEYKAIIFYQTSYASSPSFFWVSQVLAIIFFFASYYSMRTVRGTFEPIKLWE